MRKLAFLFVCVGLGCSGSVEIDGEQDDTGAAEEAAVEAATEAATVDDTAVVEEDTATIEDSGADTGSTLEDAPADAPVTACSSTPRSVDPAATIDPVTKGPLATASKTLTLPKLGALTDVKVRVTYPTAADGSPHPGRHAWVMFHHAVHGPYPGVVYDDYPTIHGHWASHGFYVFSIDGSRVFFPTTMGTSLTFTQQQTVANMMSEAITYFLEQQEKPDSEFPCRLDPTRVGIAGHSRGGGATLLVPTTRSDGAKIRGLISFQGVDPGTLTVPEGFVFPGFDLPALWLDAALDGDVIYPFNALQYGRTRGFGAMVTILGSKHTFTFDENATPHQGGTAPTVTPAEHKAVCLQYSTAFLRGEVRDESMAAGDRERISGAGGLSSAASSGGILFSYRPAKTTKFLARFDDAPGAPLGKTEDGAALTVSGAMTATPYETHVTSVASLSAGAKRVSKEVLSLQLKWEGTGGALEVPVTAGALTGKSALVFDLSMPNEGLTSGTTPLELEVRDTTGATARVAIKDHLGSGWFTRPRRLSTAYVPLSKLTGVDLGKVNLVRFVAKSGVTAGTALLDALRVE